MDEKILSFQQSLVYTSVYVPQISRTAGVEKCNPHGHALISATSTTSTALSIAVPPPFDLCQEQQQRKF